MEDTIIIIQILIKMSSKITKILILMKIMTILLILRLNLHLTIVCIMGKTLVQVLIIKKKVQTDFKFISNHKTKKTSLI